MINEEWWTGKCLNCDKELEEHKWYSVPEQFCSIKCENEFKQTKTKDYNCCSFCGLFTKKEVK